MGRWGGGGGARGDQIKILLTKDINEIKTLCFRLTSFEDLQQNKSLILFKISNKLSMNMLSLALTQFEINLTSFGPDL